jgi:hypothetical protein
LVLALSKARARECVSHPSQPPLDVPRLFTLDEAAAMLSPDGKLTARSLRSEARRGRLQLVRIAGRDFVTAESLGAMVAAATLPATRSPWPVADCQPDSISVEAETTDPAPGSFSTDRVKLALAQAQMTVQALKRPSKPISPRTTDPRVVPIDPSSSSLRK